MAVGAPLPYRGPASGCGVAGGGVFAGAGASCARPAAGGVSSRRSVVGGLFARGSVAVVDWRNVSGAGGAVDGLCPMPITTPAASASEHAGAATRIDRRRPGPVRAARRRSIREGVGLERAHPGAQARRRADGLAPQLGHQGEELLLGGRRGRGAGQEGLEPLLAHLR